MDKTYPPPPPARRMSKRLELNFELSRFCYCCNSVCHTVVVMKCMRTQDTWQKLVIGSPYWNTVVIVVEFSFVVVYGSLRSPCLRTDSIIATLYPHDRAGSLHYRLNTCIMFQRGRQFMLACLFVFLNYP